MDDLPLDGKRVLVRVDFNVSLGDNGRVDDTEDYRLEAALPTLQELQQRRCRIMLLTHMGEPQAGRGDFDVAPVRDRLQDLVGEDIRLAKHLYGNDVATIVSSMEPGSMVMLPNVRLDEREEKADAQFARELASEAEIYINEAFSVCHRDHTSVALVPTLLPSAAGRRTVLEVERLEQLKTNPKRPYVAITSGAKIESKVGMLRSLLAQVDKLCVGGKIANVFLATLGKYPEGEFLSEELAAAKELIDTAADKLVLPVDVVVGSADGSEHATMDIADIPKDAQGVWDIGEKSVRQIIDVCKSAQTVMWNGPVGRFEVPAYAAATLQLVEELAVLPAYRVIGGGDTVTALEQARKISKFDHVSVGGGAMIALLEGKKMPGLEPLYI
jgi:phosphoglycerate kinase